MDFNCISFQGVGRVKYIRGVAIGLLAWALHGIVPGQPLHAEADRPSSFLPAVAAGDWPWWRGPTLDGSSPERQLATTWSATSHISWKTPVPGRGHSSPILYGKRVFLTTADESLQKQFVLAYDRTTGRQLWSTLAHEGGFPPKNPKNSHASATSACDGERVYSVFLNHDALHVTATDLDGKILWQTKAGAFKSQHGYGSSPVLCDSLVIVDGDNLGACFLAALDRRTGKVVWRTERNTTGRNGNYATPLLAKLAGRPQLIVTGMFQVTSYDPATGKELWSCAGPSEVTACTVACSDSLVLATGGYPEKEMLAIRADGTGDVTRSHIAWRSKRGVAYVPSPLFYDGHFFVVSDSGVATCFAAATGKEVWQQRLPGSFTASPIRVGDRLYVTNEAGKTFVLKAGPRYELIATNDLGDGVLATPAVGDDCLFIRTSKNLICIGHRSGRG
jgi:outer membrane protein assembly factor BamB